MRAEGHTKKKARNRRDRKACGMKNEWRKSRSHDPGIRMTKEIGRENTEQPPYAHRKKKRIRLHIDHFGIFGQDLIGGSPVALEDRGSSTATLVHKLQPISG